MNPTAVAQPARPVASAGAAGPGASAMLTTNIVSNIPMHAPAQQPVAAPALTEDDELDTIMRDIGQQLKQADRKTTKKHFSLFRRQPKPRPHPAIAPKIKAAAPAQPAPQPVLPAQPVAKLGAALKTPPKAPKNAGAPVGLIFVTILVTGALIAAAIYSYK